MSGKSKYQFFADLRPEEYDALREDIRKRGIQVPVEVDEAGEVLDGHNRVRIAEELGVDCPRVVRAFATEEEKREHALKLNLLRRNLDAVSWAEAFRQILRQRGVKLGQGARNDKGTSATVAEVAQELGVPERTAQRRLETLKLPKPIRESVRQGEVSLKEATRQARAEERKRLHPKPVVPSRPQKPAESPFLTREELLFVERARDGHVRLEARGTGSQREFLLVDDVKGAQGPGISEYEAVLRLRGLWEKRLKIDPKYAPVPGHLRGE